MRTIVPARARLVPADAKLVFKGIIHEVYHWQQAMFDGSYETFEMLKRPDTVRVFAIRDGKIVVLKQEQPGYHTFYDLPGGRHDVEDETEHQAAQRELLEETGLTFTSWKLLDAFQPHSKIEGFIYTFLATGFEAQVPQRLDNGEKIEVQYQDLAVVRELAQSPEARYLPKEILDSVSTVEELVNLPAYTP